jgi:hypothetical protein
MLSPYPELRASPSTRERSSRLRMRRASRGTKHEASSFDKLRTRPSIHRTIAADGVRGYHGING